MENEELKEKMVKIIINAIWKDAEADYDSTDESEAISIADALIEAGYGDVEWANLKLSAYELALNQCTNVIAKQKYENEVLKKALRSLAASHAMDTEQADKVYKDWIAKADREYRPEFEAAEARSRGPRGGESE